MSATATVLKKGVDAATTPATLAAAACSMSSCGLRDRWGEPIPSILKRPDAIRVPPHPRRSRSRSASPLPARLSQRDRSRSRSAKRRVRSRSPTFRPPIRSQQLEAALATIKGLALADLAMARIVASIRFKIADDRINSIEKRIGRMIEKDAADDDEAKSKPHPHPPPQPQPQPPSHSTPQTQPQPQPIVNSLHRSMKQLDTLHQQRADCLVIREALLGRLAVLTLPKPICFEDGIAFAPTPPQSST